VSAVPCPNHTNGSFPTGCAPQAGYSGSVNATTSEPFYVSDVKAVACPDHTTGTSVPSTCAPSPGYSGSVTATQTSPHFYDSTVSAVACPKHTNGTDVPFGDCSPDPGYAGSVNATTTPPFFYNSSVVALNCSCIHGAAVALGHASCTGQDDNVCQSCDTGYQLDVTSKDCTCQSCHYFSLIV
jgi:hypothetical protein